MQDGEMSTNPLIAEIKTILLKHQRTRYAKVLDGMERGLTDAQMADAATVAGEPCNAESMAQVRRIVRLTLADELVPAPSDAEDQAGIYRELMNYERSPELQQHVKTRLTQLHAKNDKVKLTPLGDVRLGSHDAPRPEKPEVRCPDCNMVHAGDCF